MRGYRACAHAVYIHGYYACTAIYTQLQSVDIQVSVITDSDDNEWIQALKKEGMYVYIDVIE